MDIFAITGIVFGIIGIVGVIYTIYYGRKSYKKKLLIYEKLMPIPLAQAFSPEDDYNLSVVFQRKGSNEERIKSVYTTFLKFANLGRESIRGNDIAPNNPIKVNIEEARTLDIQIAGLTRRVNNISIKNPVKENNEASAEIYFDFLDFKDGALIKILTVGNEGKISLSGDIIGMPEGIKNIEEYSGNKPGGINITGWSFIIVLLAVFALSAFIHYWVTGSWSHVWLIIVPWVSLILIVLIFAAFIWIRTRNRPSFPESLDLPKWCRSFLQDRRGMMREELMQMRIEDEEKRKNSYYPKQG